MFNYSVPWICSSKGKGMARSPNQKRLAMTSLSLNHFQVKVCRFLLIILLFLPGTAYPLQYAKEKVIDYTLEVSFDMEASKMTGLATFPIKAGQEIRLDKGRLNLLSVTLDKEKIDISDRGGAVRIFSSKVGTIEIGFEGIFRSQGREETSSVIESRGIFLTGTWYPKPDQMCHYHLRAILADGFEAVSEAETIEKTRKDDRTIFAFDFPHPLDGINLIATDRYKIVNERFNGVEIFAYFFPEDAHFIPTYMEHTKHYLKLYDNLVNKFPYKRFSIVENFLPTGYSMPTYTVLGQEIVRLPFIPETSLGHEILHQWFGNLVYIDYSKGNWAEGLTTYLADHLYQEEKGLGFEYRKGTLIDYQSYVNDKNEFSLKDFEGRTDEASKAIGYGKALMVFQMLKKMVGEERFQKAVNSFTDEMRFRRASWEDIQRAFEKYYQKDLAWFFKQWIDEKGLADLGLEDIEVKPSGPKFEVTFTIAQENRAYILDLPVALYSHGGKVKNVFHLDEKKGHFKMLIDGIPERLVIDEDYDTARMLSMGEFPPVIERLLGDEQPILVLPLSETDTYEESIHAFRDKGARVSEPGSLTFKDLQSSSLAILGADNPLAKRLYGDVHTGGGFSVLMKENPWNPGKVVGIFDARMKEEVKAAFYKVYHYGKYSFLAFDHGINVRKKIDESNRGITKKLLKLPEGVEISTLKTLAYITDHVTDKKIIYIGETHDRFSHHVMQLEIIKDLRRKGRKMAIGMEMFQRPFQKALDDYVEGKIDEREFLKASEYFKRWGFDYNLYRPILQFARSEKISVVALNMKQEIVDKVFRGGLDSLSEAEQDSVPSQMDFSDDAYKERLEKIFQEHEDFKARNFNFFCQAQILWDETMSESVDQFLRVHPDFQMVVLAGSGHLEYGSGIPKRTARRDGYDYAIILNDVDVKKDIADYVLFPEAVPAPTSPRLMVLLTEEKGKLEIVGFSHGSNSEKAGIRVGDLILSIDHTPVQDISDLKIELLSKKEGEKVKVRILRRSFFGGPKELDFEVVLQ
jgi:aminopeptidase N